MGKEYNFDEIISREGTHSVKYDLRKLFFGKEDVIPMWVADMDFKTPDFIIHAIRERCDHELLGYTIHPPSFFHSIVNWNFKKHNWKIKRDWIAFSPGVVPAINMMIMAFTQPGDKIIIQPPVYHPFFHSIENHKRKLVENPLKMVNDRLEMDFDHLESCIDDQTKMLIFCHPHNPGGTVWREDELKKMGEICKEKGIIIVSDEIHADLTLWGKKHIPLASISEDISDITLTTMAPSKTFNLAALSTSYVVASNKKLLKKYNQVLEHVHIGMGNIFGTVALEAAYNEGEEWLTQLLAYIEENMQFMKEFLELNLPGVKMIMPEATYLVLLDFREFNLSQKELNDKMIKEAKIGLNDGATFGKQGEGFMRINVACPRSILSEALEQMKQVFG